MAQIERGDTRNSREAAEASQFRKCRSSGCGCTVRADETYCSAHCESQAQSAILGGQRCECGHAECTTDKPPAA
jgi:hypothetical protein